MTYRQIKHERKSSVATVGREELARQFSPEKKMDFTVFVAAT